VLLAESQESYSGSNHEFQGVKDISPCSSCLGPTIVGPKKS